MRQLELSTELFERLSAYVVVSLIPPLPGKLSMFRRTTLLVRTFTCAKLPVQFQNTNE